MNIKLRNDWRNAFSGTKTKLKNLERVVKASTLIKSEGGYSYYCLADVTKVKLLKDKP